MSKYKIDTTFISSKGYSVGYEEHEYYPVFVLNKETEDEEVISDNVFDAITEHALYAHGIWKSKSGFLVFRYASCDDEDGRCVLVVDTESGMHSLEWEELWMEYSGAMGAASREYFKAHPVPKPWHDAKGGQLWKVKQVDSYTEFAIVENINGEAQFVYGVGVGVPINSTDIETAELIK